METAEIKQLKKSNMDITLKEDLRQLNNNSTNILQIQKELESAKKDTEFWMKQYNQVKGKFESLQKALLGLSDIAKLM